MIIDMQLASTSTHRTYRYIRLGIIGAIFAIFVSLVAFGTSTGWPASLSGLYYSPGNTVFVGALFAVSFGLLALSGHSVEQAMLDLAGVVAPLIAIVPTAIAAGDVPGFSPDCPTDVPCVPDQFLPAIANGMVTFAVVGGTGVLLAVILAVVQRTVSGGLLVAVAVAAAIIAGMTLWWALDRESFVPSAHLVATAALLGFMALASIAAASASDAGSYRAVYAVIAILIVVSLLFIVSVTIFYLNGVDLVEATGAPLILIGELIALGLFAMFWVTQTAQKWDEVNPSII
jgi:nitrogen fixation-related uncharacterized protein